MLVCSIVLALLQRLLDRRDPEDPMGTRGPGQLRERVMWTSDGAVKIS